MCSIPSVTLCHILHGSFSFATHEKDIILTILWPAIIHLCHSIQHWSSNICYPIEIICDTGYQLNRNRLNCSGENWWITWWHSCSCTKKTFCVHEVISTVLQISMSMRVMTCTTVMRVQAALTQLGVSLALVTLATLEMDSPLQVCHL